MTHSKSHLLLPALLLAAALAYLNALNNPFVIDDRVIIFNNFESARSWNWHTLFTKSLSAKGPSESSYFRPLTLLTFGLNYSLAGENPAGYRIVNIAFHLLVTALVFLLLSRLADRRIAAFATLLFALHPAHVQAVSYISSRSDPLYASLALFSLLLWHRANRTEGKKRALYLSSTLAIFFLGLLAKETMIVTPALAVVIDLIFNQTTPRHSQIRKNLPWYGGFVVLFALHLLLRSLLGFPLLMEEGSEASLYVRLLIALKLFGLYLGVAFYPAHLSLFRTIEVPQSLFEWQVVLGLFLLVGMITLAWFLRESHKAVSCGILWYLVAIFPVLNLTLLNAPLMEHWLYLPLVGLMLASVALLTSLADRLGQKRAAALGLALVALLLATRTTARNNEWKDLVKLFEKDVKTYPGDSLAWFWLAKAYKERGLLANAIPAFRAGLTINPNFAKGWVEVGEALSLTGHDNEAEEALSRAVFIEPQNMWSHYLLGTHLLKQGKYQGATEALKRSIAIRPIPGAYHALGSAYLRRGQNKEAEEAFASALAIHPAGSNYHADVHVNLGRLYFRAGKRKEARAEFELALRFNPKMSIAKKLIADLDKTPPSSNRSQ